MLGVLAWQTVLYSLASRFKKPDDHLVTWLLFHAIQCWGIWLLRLIQRWGGFLNTILPKVGCLLNRFFECRKAYAGVADEQNILPWDIMFSELELAEGEYVEFRPLDYMSSYILERDQTISIETSWSLGLKFVTPWSDEKKNKTRFSQICCKWSGQPGFHEIRRFQMKPADLSLLELPKSISRKICCIKKRDPAWSFSSSDSISNGIVWHV